MADPKKKKSSQDPVNQQDQVKVNLSRDVFEEVMSRPVSMSQLDKELIISFMDFEGMQEIKTCPGDIYKIVNALMDYSRLLEMVIPEWGLEGYHQAVYELQAEQLRKIANKFSLGIGYNYYEAVEKCKKRQECQKNRGSSDSDVGEEALALSWRRSQQGRQGKEKQLGAGEDGQEELDNTENT